MTALGAIVLLAVACAAPPPSTAPPPSNPTPVAGAETPAPGAVTVLTTPWLPPWSGPATPPEIAERAGLRFCGVEQGPGPVDLAIRRCFVDSVTSGQDIEFARIEPTTEGDPIATVYGFEPPDGYVILYDSTQDAFGARGWQVTTCASIVADAVEVFRYEGCEEGPLFR